MIKTHAMRPGRPIGQNEPMNRTVLPIVRILIGSYFMATATGLIFDPSTRTFLDPLMPHQAARAVTTTYLFITAFGIMVGFFLRPASLLLALYIFWSGYAHFILLGTAEALASFWRDMALLGSVLLIAIVEPGGRNRFRLRTKNISPRRIAQERDEHVKAASQRPLRSTEQLTRDAILNGVIFAPSMAQKLNALPEDEDEDGDEIQNIFLDDGH